MCVGITCIIPRSGQFSECEDQEKLSASMTKDNYMYPWEHIFKGGYCTRIHYPSDIFQNEPDLLTTGGYHLHISHFTGCIWSTFSHILIHSDQLHASE